MRYGVLLEKILLANLRVGVKPKTEVFSTNKPPRCHTQARLKQDYAETAALGLDDLHLFPEGILLPA